MRALFTVLISLFVLTACNSNDSDNEIVPIQKELVVIGEIDVNGIINVHEIVRAEVRLIDYSIADADSIVINEAEIETIDKVPFEYSISYKESDIDESRLYSVSVSLIFLDDVGAEYIHFLTTQSYPVLTNGASSEINLLLESIK